MSPTDHAAAHAAGVSDVYERHFARPAAPIEPPQQVVDSLVDPSTGSIGFANAGPLHTIPAHPHQPELVRQAAEVTAEAGAWLSQLPERAAAIARHPAADERALHAVELEGEIERLSADFTKALRSKIGAMRDTADRLRAAMRESDDGLPADLARRLADHYHRLDDDARRAFLGKAERAGDHRVLRAVAMDPLTAYVDPALDRERLVTRAGELKYPRMAAMAAAYGALADRLQGNLERLAEIGARTAAAVVAGVPADKLALVRKARRGQGAR